LSAWKIPAAPGAYGHTGPSRGPPGHAVIGAVSRQALTRALPCVYAKGRHLGSPAVLTASDQRRRGRLTGGGPVPQLLGTLVGSGEQLGPHRVVPWLQIARSLSTTLRSHEG